MYDLNEKLDKNFDVYIVYIKLIWCPDDFYT